MPAPWEVWSRGSAPGGISSVEQSASQLATRVWLLVNNWSFIGAGQSPVQDSGSVHSHQLVYDGHHGMNIVAGL